MGLGKDYAGQNCSLARALELVGERWTLLVIRDAFYGVRRFGDFLVHLDVPRAVLTDRLNTLVDGGVLAKRRYQDAPPRDEYVLTAAGAELWPAVYVLAQWADRHLGTNGTVRLFSHAACGGALDLTGGCTACGVPVAPADVEVRPGPGAAFLRDDRVSVALREPRRLLDPLPTGTSVSSWG